jgi:hypothetical protein
MDQGKSGRGKRREASQAGGEKKACRGKSRRTGQRKAAKANVRQEVHETTEKRRIVSASIQAQTVLG